jgi:hypothetical protein
MRQSGAPADERLYTIQRAVDELAVRRAR